MHDVITIETANSASDLEQIIDLQAKNHYLSINNDTKTEQGFVTVKHNLDLLTKMNNVVKQVIAKHNNNVVGFALVMPKEFKSLIPILEPMFNEFEKIQYNGKSLSTLNYYVMGQICVDINYRGIGLVDKMYAKHKELLKKQFDLCVTEIATSNLRSIKAHERVGFKTVKQYKDATHEWNIVIWDWS